MQWQFTTTFALSSFKFALSHLRQKDVCNLFTNEKRPLKSDLLNRLKPKRPETGIEPAHCCQYQILSQPGTGHCVGIRRSGGKCWSNAVVSLELLSVWDAEMSVFWS